jgi:hypothetical protein
MAVPQPDAMPEGDVEPVAKEMAMSHEELVMLLYSESGNDQKKEVL